MFESYLQSTILPLIIVCDEKDIVYANYLIQLIGQKDDSEDNVIGVKDNSVSAAIYTAKNYKDNLPQIPSSQHIVFLGHSPLVKEQSKTISDRFNKFGMHFGWLGKRAVLYVDSTTVSSWLKLTDQKKHYTQFCQYSKERGIEHTDALTAYTKDLASWKTGMAGVINVALGAGKVIVDHNKAVEEIKAQQYKTLIKVFYEDGLRLFMEG